MNFWNFLALAILVIAWINSTGHYEMKPNFADAFNTVICGLAVIVGYIIINFVK